MQIPTQRKLITSSHIEDEDPREPNHPYLTYLYLQGNTQKIMEKYNARLRMQFRFARFRLNQLNQQRGDKHK